MADDDEQIERIKQLARKVYGPGEIDVAADGNDVDLCVDGARRLQWHAYDCDPLGALEQYLQRELAKQQKGRS